MNTLQDLRDTLHAHASDVTDTPGQARVAAVASRARVVRRRRVAGVAVAAALAVGAVVAVPVLNDGSTPAPADRQLIGKVAPATLDSLGYTYHFAEGVEGGEKHATIRLRASDEPRLITWASTEAEVGVLSNVDELHLRSRATDFDDFVLVPEGVSGSWSVRAGGAPAAIAVYELGDERPDGITVDGITFRQELADQTLIDGVIGDVGDNDVSLEFTVPDAGLKVAELCQGVPNGYWVNVEVDDGGALSMGGCSEAAPVDAGAGGATFYDAGDFPAGETVTVRTWVSRRVEGPVVEMPDARLGLAAYELAEPAEDTGTWDLPRQYEYEGHVWSQSGSVSGSVPATTVGTSADETEGLALVALDLNGQSRYRIRVNGRSQGVSTTIGGSRVEVSLQGGDAISVEVLGQRSGTVTIALYERVD